MSSSGASPRWRTNLAVAGAVLAGVAMLILLFPASGNSRQPPQCYAMFGNEVPCEAGAALVGIAAAVVIVGALLWWLARRGRAG